MRLTDFSLRSLKPRARQYAVLDETLPNFGVRVGTSGRLSFFVLYRQRGRRIRDTLGTYPTITLAEARLLARQRLAQLVLQDENPSFIPTTDFSEAVTAFLETHCAVRNKPRTAAETERLLRRHWSPAFHRRTVQEIRTGDITAVLDALLSTPSEARVALAAIRVFFNWARQRRHIQRSPCEGLRLETRPKSRARVLSDAEVEAVLQAAREMGYPYGTIVELLVLTGQRRNEIASLTWRLIDQAEKLVTLPAELVKNSREHTFVYGELVADVVSKIPHMGEYLFPARGFDDRCFSGWSKSKRALDRRCGIDFTLHDLRRTWASKCASLGVHPWVIEAHLNHVSGVVSGVAAIYNRYSYLKEARVAVDLYDQHFMKTP